MKKLLYLFGAGVLVALAWFGASRHFSGVLERERLSWEAEKAELEARLADVSSVEAPGPVVIEKEKRVAVPVKVTQSPEELLQSLAHIRIAPGSEQSRNTRLVIQHLENLIAIGPAALPAIREVLLRNEEVDYDSWISPRPSRDGRFDTVFTVPPSLRFGLLDAVRRIGGEEGEALLAEVLEMTGRGAEVAYLARVLDKMAPGKYMQLAVNSARELLANAVPIGVSASYDKYDREYLYGVLAYFKDPSFAGEAQTQLTRADGSVDRGALKYLQQTLGEQALPVIAQVFQDPQVDTAKKEPLARFALNYAGANSQATDLWLAAIMDTKLPVDHRRELIEDLNDTGFENLKNLSPRDLDLITNRLDLISRHRSNADHRAITWAFNEAGKDLKNVLARHANKPSQ